MDSDWSLLPPKALRTIFHYFDHEELELMKIVCRKWYELIKIISVDREIDEADLEDESMDTGGLDNAELENIEVIDLDEIDEEKAEDDHGTLDEGSVEEVIDLDDSEAEDEEDADKVVLPPRKHVFGGANWDTINLLAKRIPKDEWTNEETLLLIKRGVKYRFLSKRPGISDKERAKYIQLNKETRNELKHLIRRQKKTALIRLGYLRPPPEGPKVVDEEEVEKEVVDEECEDKDDSTNIVPKIRIKQEKVEVKSAWSKLFPRALKNIESYLTLEDAINLKLVCRGWNESLQQEVDPEDCDIELLDDRVVDLLSDDEEGEAPDDLLVAVIFRCSSELVVSDRDWTRLDREIASWIRKHKDRAPRYEKVKEKYKDHRLLKCLDLKSKETLSEIMNGVNKLWVSTSFEVVSKAEIPRKGPHQSLSEINRLLTKARRNVLIHKGDDSNKLGFDAFCRLAKAWEDIDRYEVIKEKKALYKELGVKDNPRKHPRKKVPKLNMSRRQLDTVANFFPHTKKVLSLMKDLNRKPFLSDDDYNYLKFGTEWLLYFKQKVLEHEEKEKKKKSKTVTFAEDVGKKSNDKSSTSTKQIDKKALDEKKSLSQKEPAPKNVEKTASTSKQSGEKKSLDGKEIKISSTSKQPDKKSTDKEASSRKDNKSSTSKQPAKKPSDEKKTLDEKKPSSRNVDKPASSGNLDKRSAQEKTSLKGKENVSSKKEEKTADPTKKSSDEQKSSQRKEHSSSLRRDDKRSSTALGRKEHQPSTTSRNTTARDRGTKRRASLDRPGGKQPSTARRGDGRSPRLRSPASRVQTVDWAHGLPSRFVKQLINYINEDKDLVAMSTVCKRWRTRVRPKLNRRTAAIRAAINVDNKLKRQIQNAEKIVIELINKDLATLTLAQQDNLLRSRLVLQRENMFDIDHYKRLASERMPPKSLSPVRKRQATEKTVSFSRQIKNAEDIMVQLINRDFETLTPAQQEQFFRSRQLLQRENMFDIDHYKRLASKRILPPKSLSPVRKRQATETAIPNRHIRNAEDIMVQFINRDFETLTPAQQEQLLRSRQLLQRENMLDIDQYKRLASKRIVPPTSHSPVRKMQAIETIEIDMDTDMRHNSRPSMNNNLRPGLPIDSSSFQRDRNEVWIQGSNENVPKETGFSGPNRERRPRSINRVDDNSNNNLGFDNSRKSFRSNNSANLEESQSSGDTQANSSLAGLNLAQNSFLNVVKYVKGKPRPISQTRNMGSSEPPSLLDIQTSNVQSMGYSRDGPGGPGLRGNREFDAPQNIQTTNIQNMGYSRDGPGGPGLQGNREFDAPQNIRGNISNPSNFQNNNFDNRPFDNSRDGPQGFDRTDNRTRDGSQNFQNTGYDNNTFEATRNRAFGRKDSMLFNQNVGMSSNMACDAPSNFPNTNIDTRSFDNARDGSRGLEPANYMGNNGSQNVRNNDFNTQQFDISRDGNQRFDSRPTREFDVAQNVPEMNRPTLNPISNQNTNFDNRRDFPERFDQPTNMGYGDRNFQSMNMDNRQRDGPERFDQTNNMGYGDRNFQSMNMDNRQRDGPQEFGQPNSDFGGPRNMNNFVDQRPSNQFDSQNTNFDNRMLNRGDNYQGFNNQGGEFRNEPRGSFNSESRSFDNKPFEQFGNNSSGQDNFMKGSGISSDLGMSKFPKKPRMTGMESNIFNRSRKY